jgi:hypothetical protein
MNGLHTLKKLSWALAAGTLLTAGSAFAQQASLNLQGSSMHYCNTVNNTWEVTKTVDPAGPVETGTAVTWTVKATKNGPDGVAPDPTFCVEGTLVITNSGAVAATIGNIVVNAQRRYTIAGKQKWISASADIADKTLRDNATQALIVAAASAEEPALNAIKNIPATYTTSGGVGTWKENAASGSIEFTDGSWSDVFGGGSTIGPGATITLEYKANFNGALMNPAINPLGDHLRTEVIVTFGNAGGRGGSGASIDNVDIDGSGNVSADEAHVRSVPVRASLDVPPLEQCLGTVSLSDILTGSGVTATVNGGTRDPVVEGGVWPTPDLSDTADDTTTWTLVTQLDGEGTMTNEATLTNDATDCCDALNISASAIITVTNTPCTANDPRPSCNQLQCPCGESEQFPGRCNVCTGGFCSYTQGKYNDKAKNPIVKYLQANFGTLFPSGAKIGDQVAPIVVGNSPAPWTAYWNDVGLMRQYFAGNGGNGALTKDYTNPTSTEGRHLGSQVLAMTVSVTLSAAGITPAGLGSVLVCPAGGSPCSGVSYSISQLIGFGNAVLAGSGSTGGFDAGGIASLITLLNEGFDDCTVSAWAATHTTPGN